MPKWITQLPPVPDLTDTSEPNRLQREPKGGGSEWTKDICPNCGFADADVDAEGVLWCPACGYSRKGCYT